MLRSEKFVYRGFWLDTSNLRAARGMLALVYKPLGKKHYWEFQVGGKRTLPVWRYPASPQDVKQAIDGWYYDIGNELDKKGLANYQAKAKKQKDTAPPTSSERERAVSRRRSGRPFSVIRKNSSLKLRGWSKEALATFSKKELEAYEIANENFTMAVDQKESRRNDYPNSRWTIFDAYRENAMDTARSVLGREYVDLTGSLFVDLIRLNKIKDAGWLSSDA